jgi:hypothetical protein
MFPQKIVRITQNLPWDLGGTQGVEFQGKWLKILPLLPHLKISKINR